MVLMNCEEMVTYLSILISSIEVLSKIMLPSIFYEVG